MPYQTCKLNTRGGKVMPQNYFSENVTAMMKFTWIIHASFVVMRLFFHKATIIFNTFLLMPSETLYTNVTCLDFGAHTLKLRHGIL
jgi:hypothetical protein